MNQSSDTTAALQAEHDKIARELHDCLGQALTSLKMDVAWLARHLANVSQSRADILQRLSDMSECLDTSIDEVRDVARWLRTPGIQAEDLGMEIDAHVRIMAARADLMVFSDIRNHIPVTDTQAIDVFRIVQESVTNIVRHAQARAIWISLETTPAGIELRIRDDGRGLRSSDPSSERASLGWTGMTERARALGAQLTIQSIPQGGTLVHLQIPFPTPSRSAVQSTSTRKGA